MSRWYAVPVLVAALAAGFVGCGSSDSSSTSSSGTTAAPAPASTTADTGQGGAIGTAKGGDLGTILVDSSGRTVYLWEADTGSTSTCSGACAAGWPPVLTKGAPTAKGDAQTSQLGTTKRSDGTTQVTYAGHPLYRYALDTAPGQTSGQGNDAFGAKWYVLAPSGQKVGGGGSGSTGGGY